MDEGYRAKQSVAGNSRDSIVAGSDAHKALFCAELLDTHDPYQPAILKWPVLDHAARERLVALPIWNMAIQVEEKATRRILAYTEGVEDPLLNKALRLMAFEEGRHKEVLLHLIAAYGIERAAEAPYIRPHDPEYDFMVTGFSECIDSFFAFGLFEIARRSGFFPAELVNTFEYVIQEEGRHILFFINWVHWRIRNLPWWRRILFRAKIARVWLFLIWERIELARGAGGEDNNFAMTGATSLGSSFDFAQILDICLAENDRRLGRYDSRLLRPMLVPSLVRFVRKFLRASRKATVAAD